MDLLPLLQGKGQGCHSNVPVFLPLARVSSLNLCSLALFVLTVAISWSTNLLEAKSLLLILAADFMKFTSSQFPVSVVVVTLSVLLVVETSATSGNWRLPLTT